MSRSANREREVFERAVELPDDERPGFLHDACATDSELEDRVRRLLDAHATATEHDVRLFPRLPGVDDDEPEQIGPYRILERVGQGGMGVVYVAEQSEPIRRKVALKIIKLGMDTREVIARFESERQALALMSHPNIARILDAGSTERGRPYFVMEHVRGIPIVEYANLKRLSIAERLRLFVSVCRAVQHAHQKGIIHRDLKPSNILIAEEEGEAVPKVIDFGVAKAIDRRLGDHTLHTELGQMIGTPDYMSPEQANMTALDVDTRSDVYALGVVLFELLVGSLPFALGGKSLSEIQQIIQHQDPEPPSRRASRPGSSLESIAEERCSTAGTLWREVRGELDWITMAALHKDRRRRYQTPSALADDVERYLKHEPVQVSSPSTLYRMSKFVRRHAVFVGTTSAAAVVFLALVAFYTLRLTEERDRANREARAKGLVSDFLTDLFVVSDPSEARGNRITARELLDRGATKVDAMLAAEPDVGAGLVATMGEVYRNLGLFSRAEPLLLQALEASRERSGEEHPETLGIKEELATLYWQQARYDEAEPVLVEVRDAFERQLGELAPETINAAANLAALYAAQNRDDEAEALYVETLDTARRALGEDHEHTATLRNNLATHYANQGRFDEAEPLLLEAFEARVQVVGEDHPSTLMAMSNLALLYKEEGRLDEAESLTLECLEARRRVLGDDHPATLASLGALGGLYRDMDRVDEAEPLLVETYESRRRVLGDDHHDTIQSMNNVAQLYRLQGRLDEAERYYVDSLEAYVRVLGEDHRETLAAMNNLAFFYREQDRYDEAEPLYEKALEIQRRQMGDDHPHTLTTLGNLGDLYVAVGRPDDGEPLLAEAVERESGVFGRHHWSTAITIRKYGVCLTALRRYDEAEATLLEAHGTMAEFLGEDHPQTRKAVPNLVALYEAWDKPAEAAAWRAR